MRSPFGHLSGSLDKKHLAINPNELPSGTTHNRIKRSICATKTCEYTTMSQSQKATSSYT
ncbi:hypothetical protein GmHk_11G032409 [Glycine max]|nr:hypothetical protein GmHk_11G032409 [Glycine max]